MKKAVIVFLLALLFVLPVKAEVMLGDLVLELADEHEYNDTINRHSLNNNVHYLDNARELKIGEIYDVDIVENTVLIAISYYDYTQVWIYNLSGDFQYGYELPFASGQSYVRTYSTAKYADVQTAAPASAWWRLPFRTGNQPVPASEIDPTENADARCSPDEDCNRCTF